MNRPDVPTSRADAPAGDAQLKALHDRIERDFTYHPPRDGQPALYEALRNRFRELAHFIADNVPHGREQQMALTDLERASQAANAGIARHG